MPSERVTNFYDLESFAIIGLSTSKRNIAWTIYEQLIGLDKRVYAINSKGGEKNGIRLFGSLKSLPEVPEGIIVCVDLRNSSGLLESLVNSGSKNIWFQQGTFDNDIVAEAAKLGIEPIKGCALMYMPGTPGFHRFHRALNELFGKGYK
jgi:uncharacterized protein